MLSVELSCLFMQVPFCTDLRSVMFVGAEWLCFNFFFFFTHEYTCTHLTTDQINTQTA